MPESNKRLTFLMEETVETYFKQANEHLNFIRVSLQKNEALVGCCTGDLQAAQLAHRNGNHELSPGGKPQADRLGLPGDLVTGRQPIPILTASIFLAWQSLKPTQTQLKYMLARFSKSLQTVIQMVDGILNHRFTLLRRALSSHEDTLASESELPPHTNTPCLEGAVPSQTSGQTLQEPFVGEPDAESAQQQGDVDLTYNVVIEGLPQADTGKHSAQNRGKRSLFEQPSVMYTKIRMVQVPMVEVAGDEEISDSEFDSYIRTPQEIRDYTEAKEALAYCDATSTCYLVVTKYIICMNIE
ncbi:unnamed protein product [Coregonus sp. 'balchen']|nr:unnamed protein product [Coregonus sp. 'balchen']